MEKPEERLEKAREKAQDRSQVLDNVLDATRLALQSAPVLGIAQDGRPIMSGKTIYEIRLKLADLGLSYAEEEIARTAEKLVSCGEANLMHADNNVPAYQWWPPANEDVA